MRRTACAATATCRPIRSKESHGDDAGGGLVDELAGDREDQHVAGHAGHGQRRVDEYLVADPLTRDTGDTPWLAGEFGAVVTLVTVVAVALWWRRVRDERHRPRVRLRAVPEAS